MHPWCKVKGICNILSAQISLPSPSHCAFKFKRNNLVHVSKVLTFQYFLLPCLGKLCKSEIANLKLFKYERFCMNLKIVIDVSIRGLF
jgi:hypothetical protein